MKIHFKHPDGWELLIQSKPREPMELSKFYALIGLLAGALVVALFLGGIALR